MATISPADLVVALDVDGVLVEADMGEHWLTVVAGEFDFTPEEFQPFFRDYWGPVMVGEHAVEDALAQFMPNLDVELLLRRWFEESTRINREIVDAAADWHAAGARLVLATNQEHRRAAYLKALLADHLELHDVFYSADLGVGKPDARFFGAADKRLGGARVVFIDDALANVEAARAHGWSACHYPHDADWRERVDSYFK